MVKRTGPVHYRTFAVGIVLWFSCGPDSPWGRQGADLAARQYEFAAELLDAFLIFRDRLPSDLYGFDTPEDLYESAGDRFTFYLDSEASKPMRGMLSTDNYGIGILIDTVQGIFYLKRVFPDAPGARAGLQDLDTIVTVGTVQVTGLTVEELMGLLRGENGSGVVIGIKRGEELRNFTIVRGPYRAPSVFVDLIDSSTAMITLTGFFENTCRPGGSSAEFTSALEETDAQKTAILDLRGNGGGLVWQCFEILGTLVPQGTPMIRSSLRNIDPETGKPYCVDTVFLAEGSGIAADRTWHILVDSNTASASELLTSCLMQRPGVTVIGDTTFGKARGQQPAWGPDSVYAQVTCMLLEPVGTSPVSYDETGIIPDVTVGSSEDAFELAMERIHPGETVAAKRRRKHSGSGFGFTDGSPLHFECPAALLPMRYHHD